MTSTRNPLQDFVLTPQQQNLLFAALNSNKPGAPSTVATSNSAMNLSPLAFDGSPTQGLDAIDSFQNSPDLDYEYDFGAPDSSFDFSFNDTDQPKMIGDLPTAPSTTSSGSPEGDSPDKRSHPDDDEDENGDAKRREGGDKIAKKPGRKPLTTEPSSKRKAQNRAAQRAFRERKEKHLKDLETKVEELQKASESTNHENEILRAKVEKMTVELNEYKKRISIIASSARPTARVPVTAWGSTMVNSMNDVSFQFEFPKFGARPVQPTTSITDNATTKKPSTSSVGSSHLRRNNSDQVSPLEKPKDGVSPSNSSSYSQVGLDSQAKEDLAQMSSALFNSPRNSGDVGSGSNMSLDSHFSTGAATSTSSPSASSNSNMGATSSCGTSPEPFTQSPMGFKPIDTLTTIGEEQPTANNSTQEFGTFDNVDMNFNWLPQNDFQFDPHLFGDYREPQENVLTNGLDDTFFNDAFDMDFTTPYNLPVTSPAATKKGTDLISQIDAAKDSDDTPGDGEIVRGQSLLTCNKIWERLQNCPKVQSGDFDLDGLCSDLQKKAKCSGTGAVVDESDFKKVMKKYLGGKDECQLVDNAKAT
ncbi:transcription factor PAP1-domain-containing protein [Apodospora peruviana]|uniref:Transcription factor PAP1-domain-containing protein n=1 Tax=Apodospora peruviana TaxID=516989 RepID=A0AAE0I096_9PEZI|nr:transcription factor PAP1-domain-containing protein [Apodospora peruviana]